MSHYTTSPERPSIPMSSIPVMGSGYPVPGHYTVNFGQPYPPVEGQPSLSPPGAPPVPTPASFTARVVSQSPRDLSFNQRARAPNTQQAEQVPRFIICIDYGTTFTGVAWALRTREVPTINDIKVVRDWKGHIAVKVPSLYTYSRITGELWDAKLDEEAYVIREAKLNLEKPDRITALRTLKRTLLNAKALSFNTNNVGLNSEVPRHLCKSSSDVVVDYLSEITDVAAKVIGSKNPRSLREFPIDLIITHPAEWDYRARNLTFRSVNKAFREGFSESTVPGGVIRMASEPEACAQYTMKHGQDEDLVRLRPGQCFMVVDAGGGTVDLVSYRVTQVEPTFQFEKINGISPISGRFGATKIDAAFTKFVEDRLGPENYTLLLGGSNRARPDHQGEHTVLGRNLQRLHRQFQVFKENFAGRSSTDEPDLLDLLIEGIQDNAERGIEHNQLRISSADMENMFKLSVNGTIQLISKQLTLVDGQGLRVKTIFLSGGFSQSPYLRSRVQQIARGWRIDTVWGRESQTAVAQGGVMLGLGINCERPNVCVECPFYIGVVLAERWMMYNHDTRQEYQDSFDNKIRAKDNVKWLVNKGDLITTNERIEITQKIIRKIAQKGNKAGRVQLVFSTLDCVGQPPTQLEGDDYTRWTKNLDYDLQYATLPLIRNREANTAYHQATMHLDITVDQQKADFELVVNRTVDALGNITLSGRQLRNRTVFFEDPRA
ncbi:hypothetical protein BGZ63DRAFT_269464 [Mariannaea sp. PMI_226]|nr:hypothetical protein BGZ63DRAFT_269464 [Mariannaea sp. PMI_226]